MRKKVLLAPILLLMFLFALAACGESGGLIGPGTGEKDNPFIIAKASDLVAFRDQVNAGETFEGRYFALVANISLGGAEWEPIGLFNYTDKEMLYSFNYGIDLEYDNFFAGCFDGRGYTISNFKITKPYPMAGLFGRNAGTIKNLNVKNYFVDISIDGGNPYINEELFQTDGMVFVWTGGLAGRNYGLIENASATGDISVSVTNMGEYTMVALGGLVATNWPTGIIRTSYATGDVLAISTYEAAAGGLVAGNYGIVENCYATGNAEAQAISAWAGGLVTRNHNRVENCYATGNAKALGSKLFELSITYITGGYAGGLMATNWYTATVKDVHAAGNAEASGVYATAGGLVGWNQGGLVNGVATGNVKATAIKEANEGSLIGSSKSHD
jgi:hypothetical protein